MPPRMGVYAKASKAVFEVFRQTTPLVEGSRSTRRSWTSAGSGASRARPPRSPCGCGARSASGWGCPSPSGWPGPRFLAKVASGVAKPDGLLMVPPDGELAFLHPLPVERLWGVGPVTAGKLRDLGVTTVGQVARLGGPDAGRWSARRPAGTCTRAGPQPATRGRSTPAGGGARSGPSGRLVAPPVARRPRRRPDGAGRAGHPADAGRRADRPDGSAAPALRRLLAGDPLPHLPGRPATPTPSWPRPATCWPRPCR